MAKKPAPNGGEPYPDHVRPTSSECQAVRDALADLHGARTSPVQELEDRKDVQSVVKQTSSSDSVLDSLVRTILSQNTTDTTSHRAFTKLKECFPTWEEVRQAPPERVEEAIKEGGLAKTKTTRMQAIFSKLQEERGECSLEYLRSMTDEEIKQDLGRFKGVGSKTIACVLMFCLGSHEFPVDTHVWRIAKSLGWVPNTATRDNSYEHLNRRIPDQLKYELHVLLVEHGKRCERCAKNGRPRKEVQGPCPLTKVKQQTTSAKAAADSTKEDVKVKEEDSGTALAQHDSDTTQAKAIKSKPAVKVEDDILAGKEEVNGPDQSASSERDQRNDTSSKSKRKVAGKKSGDKPAATQGKRKRVRK